MEFFIEFKQISYRTGTFVAMEMAISRLKRKEAISICDLAKALREQRMGAIQNDQVFLAIAYYFFHR